MVIDATKRGSIPHDSDFQNLLSETLTTFLTSILGKRRTSFLEKSREVILYLLEARGNEGRRKEARGKEAGRGKAGRA